MVAEAIVRLKEPTPDEDGQIEYIDPEPDPMQGWIDECNQAGDDMDARRWLIGLRASQVVAKYSEDRLGYFAAQIHQAKSTVYEYEAMHSFYADERRRYNFLEASPTLRYTHFRTAKSRAKKAGGSVDQAYLYLDKAAIRGWTPDQFGKIMTRAFRIFGDEKKPRPIVKNAPVKIMQFDELNNGLCLQIQDDKQYAKLLKANNEGRLGAVLMTLK